MTTSTSGRGWAYTGAGLGGVISIVANVAHSFVAPPGASADWTPKPGAIGFAMAWPILLFIALGILERVAWLPGWRWALLRLGGLLPIVAITGIVSWRHQSGLLRFYGEDDLVSFLGPLAVDGLMVMSTTALQVIAIRSAVNAARQPATGGVPSNVANDYATHSPASTQRDLLPVTAGIEVPEHLVSTARFAVSNHENRYGQTMTADQLSQVMNVDPDIAREILATITPAPVLNGHASGGAS